MGRRPVIAVAAAAAIALGLLSPAEGEEPLCELGRVDRGATSSRECLACHDGTVTGATMHPGQLGPGGNHPLDVSYEGSRLLRIGLLRPRALLPSALALPDGKVTCTTCHDQAGAAPTRLSMSNQASALCLACHDY